MSQKWKYTEYRLEWTYPYLKNRGETEFTFGQSVEDARGNARKDEGFYWAGEEVSWAKREVFVHEEDWEEFTP